MIDFDGLNEQARVEAISQVLIEKHKEIIYKKDEINLLLSEQNEMMLNLDFLLQLLKNHETAMDSHTVNKKKKEELMDYAG
jgi:hypothetical protein